VGQVFFANKQQPAFLGAMGEAGGQYSDETAKTIDEEVRRIIENSTRWP
jgi:ATP-dependent Zn protease